MSTLILFNKPYGVLSQFTDVHSRATLADYIQLKHVYPAGRLDYDSEGLLLLTDDGKLQQQLSNPRYKFAKTYWVQVEGIPSDSALVKLRRGVLLKDGISLPAHVNIMQQPSLWPRTPPIRSRKAIPTTWLALTITEGRNRQVRRMTAAIGHPTLRLVRYAIGSWNIQNLEIGTFRIVDI